LAADWQQLKDRAAVLNIAVRAARRAGAHHTEPEPLESLTVSSKGATTSSPRSTTRRAGDHRQHRRLYPQHAFLAEKAAAAASTRRCGSSILWMHDQLLHGFPVFAVSIACQVRGRLEQRGGLRPMRGELFTAAAARAHTWTIAACA